MNLPDALIAQEGFFATHFFTVRHQEKSKDFYVRILGAKVIKPENPCYIKLANKWIILNSGGPDSRQARSYLKRPRISTEGVASLTCVSPTSRLLQTMGRQRSILSY
jgi:hypothetical protein